MSEKGPERPIPDAVVRAFPALDAGYAFIHGEVGLLHETRHLKTSESEFVLQCVNEVFAPEIHDNIAAVTDHLTARGFATFQLLPTRDGMPFFDLEGGGRWRLMTRLPGVSFHAVQSTPQVESAGALVGRFHRALEDFDAPLAPMGIPFRDTALYLSNLDEAIDREGGHPFRDRAGSLRDQIRSGFARLGPPPETRLRVIHGDLKISNVLFAGERTPDRDRAIALIDFDTLMRAPLWSEWGDAWRSWCNSKGEDERVASFDLDLFTASLVGFARGYAAPIEPSERDSLLHATERLALELAARYTTDILEERYFAWDAARFTRSAEHNLLRAEGQLSVFEGVRETEDERRRILEEHLAVETR